MNRPETTASLLSKPIQQKRWMMWIFLVLLHLVTSFHRVSFNVVADLLTAEFNLTGVGLGNLAAAYTYMYLIMQIPGGVLVDRLGPRRIAFLTGLSMAVGSILIGFASNAVMIFIGRMFIGIGGSIVLINIFKFQASWFRTNEFATMSGLALLLSGNGALLAATPLAVSAGLFGWRPPFVAVGFVTFFIALCCSKLIQNKPILYINSIDGKLGADEFEETRSAPMRKAILSLFKNRQLWAPFFINVGVFGGFIVFSGTWGVSYMVHVYGIRIEEASVFMILTYLGYMIGAPLVGFVSDRTGTRKVPALILILLYFSTWAAITFWPAGPIPLVLLYVLSPVMGFGAAANVLTFPMARESSPPGFTGLLTATVNVGVFLGLAILQPLVGYILDLGWEGLIIEGARIYPLQAYRLGFLACFLFAVIALIAVVTFQENKSAEIYRK